LKFEKQFLETSTQFYKTKASSWHDQFSCYEYVMKITNHLDKELKNSDAFLQEQSKEKIKQIVLEECVVAKADSLTDKDSGCKFMFNERKIQQLKDMYDIFRQADSTIKFII